MNQQTNATSVGKPRFWSAPDAKLMLSFQWITARPPSADNCCRLTSVDESSAGVIPQGREALCSPRGSETLSEGKTRSFGQKCLATPHG
jgi:hypothetical protein